MEVDFNQLRLQAAIALDKVIQQLKGGMLKEREHVLQDEEDIERWIEGDILVEKVRIEEPIRELRQILLILAACHNGNGVEDISGQIEQMGGIISLNEEEEC